MPVEPGTGADAVEWTRSRWLEAGMPAPDHFAAMAALMRAHQRMIEVVDDVLKRHDLGRNGFLLMCTLVMARGQPQPLGRVGRQMMVHPTTVTVAVDHLEKRGLVRRVRHPSDRRTVLAELTTEGEAIVSRASDELSELSFGLGLPRTSQARQLVEGIAPVLRGQGGDH